METNKPLIERAREFAVSMDSGYDDSQISGLIEGYLAGYNDAKLEDRWRDATIELPPLVSGKHYLVKVEHSFPKNCKCLICEFYEDTQGFRCESSEEFIDDVTYWKPITI